MVQNLKSIVGKELVGGAQESGLSATAVSMARLAAAIASRPAGRTLVAKPRTVSLASKEAKQAEFLVQQSFP